MADVSWPPFWVVIPAAGIGSRMGSDRPKQYLPLAGRSILEHTLGCFLEHPGLRSVAVALAPDDGYWPQLAIAQDPRILTAVGGTQRADSVLNALEVLRQAGAKPEDWVLVHDAVRPNLSREDLDLLLTSLADDPLGGILAVPLSDTLKRSDGAGHIRETLDRTNLWQAYTPQMFRLGLLKDSLAGALAAGLSLTDEASVLEWAGHSPRLVQGHADNRKVTRQEDLLWMRRHFRHRAE